MNCDNVTSADAHIVTDCKNETPSCSHVIVTDCFMGDHSDIYVNALSNDNVFDNTDTAENCADVSDNTDLAESYDKTASNVSKIECDDKFPDDVGEIACIDSNSNDVCCNHSPFKDPSKNDFSSTIPIKCDGFKIGCLNVRSLHPKFEEISRFVIASNFDIFIANETWLDSSFTDADLEIYNYNIFRRDRNRHGGGVCIYVKTHLKCNLVHGMGINIESLWLSLCIDNENFIVGSIYRPPSSDSCYNEQMLDEIEKLKNLCDNVILLGDLNCDCFKKNPTSSNLVSEIEDLFDMKQLIDEPTRETLTCSSLIDIILTTVPEKHEQTGVLKVSLSDHYCTQTILKSHPNPMKEKHNLVTYNDFKNFHLEGFVQDIRDTLQNLHQTNCNNVCQLWESFKLKFLEICRKHVPLVQRRLKRRYKPWVSHDIIQLMYTESH